VTARLKRTLIRGGTAVVGPVVSAQDILVEGERILAVGDLKGARADDVVDASGLLVLPGAVDTHVHFKDAFMGTTSVHDYASGTRAAAFGGVTSIVDFSNQVGGEPLTETLRRKEAEARGRAIVDWGVHPVITRPTRATLRDIAAVAARGAPTIKCYMTYRKEGLMVSVEDLAAILRTLRRANGMLLVHAEDNDMVERNVRRLIAGGKTRPIHHAESRPPAAENKAIAACLRAVRVTGGRLFIVHMATAEGLALVAAARAEGLEVFAETCTHYLVFTEKMLAREDGIKWICSPALRPAAVRDRLWEALEHGPLSQVTSDDAAFSWAAKSLGRERFDRCPNGIPGVEVRLSVLFSEGVQKGRISLSRLVELVSTAPARLFGLAPRKGSLVPGADADIVLFDPEEKWTMGRATLHMAADWSAYEGIPVTGRVRRVYSRGALIIDGGRCLAEKGRGKYIFRTLEPPRRRKSRS
jgi:dihydropyrimidinase